MSVRREREARRRVVDLEHAEEGALGRQDRNAARRRRVDAPGAVDGEARAFAKVSLVEDACLCARVGTSEREDGIDART